MTLPTNPDVVTACRNALGLLGVDHEAMTDGEVVTAVDKALGAVRDLGAALTNVARSMADAFGSISAELHRAAEQAERDAGER